MSSSSDRDVREIDKYHDESNTSNSSNDNSSGSSSRGILQMSNTRLESLGFP